MDARPTFTDFHTYIKDNHVPDFTHSLKLFVAPDFAPGEIARIEFSPTLATLSIPCAQTREGSSWLIAYSQSIVQTWDMLAIFAPVYHTFSGILMNAEVVLLYMWRLSQISGFDELDIMNWGPVLAPFVNACILGITDGLEVPVGRILDACTEGGALEGSLPALRKVVILYEKKKKRRTPEQKIAFDSYIAKQRRCKRIVEVSYLRASHRFDKWWEL
ncbi:hypothetical protein BC834DRAFT_435402 [Gloeopeniophorella convolvens]|nr:hypothetical protein BC834DRAFT_435402 [Gloeopeniophorella convolvens]